MLRYYLAPTAIYRSTCHRLIYVVSDDVRILDLFLLKALLEALMLPLVLMRHYRGMVRMRFHTRANGALRNPVLFFSV